MNTTDEITKTKVIVLHETVGQSIAKDAATVGATLLLWSIGHFADSAALEWIGCVMAGIFIFSRGVKILRGEKIMTPEEARKAIDKIAGELG